MDKRQALGKGLSALIPDAPDAVTVRGTALEIDIDLLEPNDYQPRHHLDDERLEHLARSIKANGVIQPIIARRLAPQPGGARDLGPAGPTRYQIIAGERRWRAAQRAGLQKVPV